MDRFVQNFPAIPDGDLMLCPEHGVAYQADMSLKVEVPYFEKCGSYEGQDIARKINVGRITLVNRFAGFYMDVLDVGVGSGEFIKSRPYTFGYDIDPNAVKWLQHSARYSKNFAGFRAFTFWDVIEHLPDPDVYFRHVRSSGFVFTCLPIFSDLRRIRESRHYRPGEHLYYFTEAGFVAWMELYGFALLERADYETVAGRDSILSFAFRRN